MFSAIILGFVVTTVIVEREPAWEDEIFFRGLNRVVHCPFAATSVLSVLAQYPRTWLSSSASTDRYRSKPKQR